MIFLHPLTISNPPHTPTHPYTHPYTPLHTPTSPYTPLHPPTPSILTTTTPTPTHRGTDYHVLNKNCNAFADEFLLRIMGRGSPGYVNRMAFYGERGGRREVEGEGYSV
ncbi:hypothetical protein B484DRAFT_321644 [Ochromonadaceae sp. CCMP2298]|nr:hypothetical protein B484DRAFT_321644 [Ochromonadaceae sp. CCMP2298]